MYPAMRIDHSTDGGLWPLCFPPSNCSAILPRFYAERKEKKTGRVTGSAGGLERMRGRGNGKKGGVALHVPATWSVLRTASRFPLPEL